MYIPYVSCSYRLNIHNPCYLGTSNSCKHMQIYAQIITGWLCLPRMLGFFSLNHMKIVYRGDNLNKKLSYIYIPYVSYNYRLSRIFACKFGKGPKVGVRSSDRLDASTLIKSKTHNRLTIQTSEWENLSIGVGILVASKWGFCPISRIVNLVRPWKIGCIYSERG